MAGAVSRKLSNAFEGALAGGGDPATSPLYVFGPFFKLLVVAGVAEVVYGASIWLVLLTVAVVSAMYRLVMRWVTDGSGGSGLTEEEFGGWAVKVNASITYIEYTLTFLVSVAALVTFVADRFPVLNQPLILGLSGRLLMAIGLSVLTGWLVNLGPKVAARTFGPATLAVLLLLWAMILATIFKLGVQLPPFHWQAFSWKYLPYTLGGYARILALMTGIEVFANLVAAYEGKPEEKARKAFGSLLIIMGSTGMTMLIVGPAIHRLADPLNEHVSVFTQTMDYLLPAPLPYIGTLIGVLVLLSASAASAQGIQNLSLGLADRHYVPPSFGRRNQHGVPPAPVWAEVAVVSVAFLLFGTREETYLSLYAAGVFILLSMTAWAVVKRLGREIRQSMQWGALITMLGSVLAAALTTMATVIIFGERLREGAWMYFVLIPMLYSVLTYFRNRLGSPSLLREQLGRLEEAMWTAGTGRSQAPAPAQISEPLAEAEALWEATPERIALWRSKKEVPRRILVPLDGSRAAERGLAFGQVMAAAYGAKLILATVLPPEQDGAQEAHRRAYLEQQAAAVAEAGVSVQVVLERGEIPSALAAIARQVRADLLIVTSRGQSVVRRFLLGQKAGKIIEAVSLPTLVVRPIVSSAPPRPRFRRILVPLDGTPFSERILPYVRSVDPAFHSEVILLSVPEVPEPELFGLEADVVLPLRRQAEARAREYLSRIAEALREDGLQVKVVVTGTDPDRTIVRVAEEVKADLVMLTTHGRMGLDRLFVGATADWVIRHTLTPVFLLPPKGNGGT